MRTIDDEQAELERLMPSFVNEHTGQAVLFRDGTAEFHATFDDAFRAGLQRFGLDTPFVVTLVAPDGSAQSSPALELGVMFRG